MRPALPMARAALLGAVVLQATIAIVARAQDSAAARTAPHSVLRLGTLYDEVGRDNPRAAAARSLARAAEARVPTATRPPDPQLQLGFMNYTLPGLAPMATLGMTQLQLMQMVPLGGKLSMAGRAAAASASAARERAEDVSWELRSEAAMAFYDLYAAERQLDISRVTLRLLRDIEKTAESMYRVGEGRQADVLRAQVEIAKMAEDTLRMQAMAQVMTAKLNALLDRDLDAAIGSPVLPAFPDSLPSRAWLDSLAATARPMIRAGLDEVGAADASEKLARKELWPDLQIGAQYAQRGGQMGGTERMGSIMIGASIPVFARDRQLRMREEAGAMKQMAEADLAAMRADTRARIGEAYASLVRARNLSKLYRTTMLPQARATVESALAAYGAGRLDFMTLLDDRMTVNRYEQELHALDADQGKAWADLEMLTGRELCDPNQARAVSTTAAGTGGGR